MKNYIRIALLYIVIQGIGMAMMYYGFGIVYGEPGMANVVLWVEIILALLVVFYVRRTASWRAVGFGKINWLQTLWIVPNLLLVLLPTLGILAALVTGNLGGEALLGVVTAGALTLLVGFAEEAMFRGIVLRGALQDHGVYVAMLISALTFTLLHMVNVLGGLPPGDLPNHLFSQLLYGAFMAPLALLIRNLVPLILLHFMWDFSVLAGALAPTGAQSDLLVLLPGLSSPIQIVLTVILWVVVLLLRKKDNLQLEKSES